MDNKAFELNNKLKVLPFSKKNKITDEVINSTDSSLKALFCEYGYAEVLGELSALWTVDKAIEFFSKTSVVTHHSREIHTVAVFYIRGYNGGIERVNAELMQLWLGMGYKVVFFSDEPENSLDFSYPGSVKRIVIPSRNNMYERLSALQKYCFDEHVDLFINHNWNDSRSVWECMLMKNMGISYVQYCHGHFSWCFVQGKPALYQPEFFRMCDLTIALSETNARFYQLSGCRSYLVQNPVPGDLLDVDAGRSDDSCRILLVGRLSEEKYPMDALQIFKIVHDKHPEAVLDIVGDGEEKLVSQMKAFVTENSMGNTVFFHGRKNNGDVAEFYKKACCVLFTSKMEGYPMVVLEAKAFGLPLVMYDMPFLSLTKDGLGMLAAAPGDIRAMSDDLNALLSDKELRQRLSNESKESFLRLKEYDLEKAWSEVFDICSGESVDSDDYYDPDQLPVPDRYIISALLDKIKEGYDLTVFASRDYKLGASLLRIPRKVKKLVRKDNERQ